MPAGLILAVAIVIEVIATVSLKLSVGFTRPLPTVVSLLGYTVSIFLLAQVVKQLDVGFTYAIWAGAGTAATAAIGVILWGEPMGAVKIVSLMAVIAGVVGLNLAGAH